LFDSEIQTPPQYPLSRQRAINVATRTWFAYLICISPVAILYYRNVLGHMG